MSTIFNPRRLTSQQATSIVVAFALFAIPLLAAPRLAHACTYGFEDLTYSATEAPPGGLWWTRSWAVGDTIELTSPDLTTAFQAEVVFRGLSDLVALRVPEDAIAGEEYLDLLSSRELLIVGTGVFDAPQAPVDIPQLEIEFRETRVGYTDIVSSPFTVCTQAPGLWSQTYEDLPWVIGSIPVGHMLDVTARIVDEPAFTDFDNANVMTIVGRAMGPVEELVGSPPPGDVLSFNVHARLVRGVDGAVSETLVIPVQASPLGRTERTELVGCTSTFVTSNAAPTAAFGLLMMLALFRRRKSRES